MEMLEVASLRPPATLAVGEHRITCERAACARGRLSPRPGSYLPRLSRAKLETCLSGYIEANQIIAYITFSAHTRLGE